MYNASFQGKKDGLERAKNAVIGFVLILTSYIIMRTIDPRLVEIPNSLVPQITVNKYLAQDANQLLMNQVQSDIDKSKIQITEYYDKMQQASKSVADKQKEIDDIKKQIEDIKSNPAGLEAVGAEQKIRELQIKQAKGEEELAALQVTSTVATVKQRVNLVLSVAQDNFQVGTDVIVKNSKDLIKQINDSETQIGMIKAQGTGALTKAGNGEYWKVTEQTDYGYAILDSYKINLMINSIQYVPRTASRSSVLITDSNGNNKEFYTDPKGKTDIQQANDFIQNEIQNLTKTQGSITDEELKSNIQKRIVDVTNKLNGNPILNPAKK
jgi:archaellum component FlaF (FlaF/FlaG flagellin family)